MENKMEENIYEDLEETLMQEHFENYDEDEESFPYLVRFDEDGQNLDEIFENADDAMEYARENISNGPVVYYIDEDGNEEVYYFFEEAYSYFSKDDD